MKIKDNLDVDEFLAEVGVAKIFSNHAEFDAIYQLCSTSSFSPPPPPPPNTI